MEILWKMFHKILWKTQMNFLANPVYGVIPLKKKKNTYVYVSYLIKVKA